MKEGRVLPAEEKIDLLEHDTHVQREAIVAQLRALSRSIEQLASAVEASAAAGGTVPEGVAERIERARWELKSIW